MRAAEALAAERINSPLEGTDGELLIGATLDELVRRSLVGYEVSRTTVKNMVRAGDLQVIGRLQLEWMERPCAVYAPCTRMPVWAQQAAAAELLAIADGWART